MTELLTATTPNQMAQAQLNLVEWCEQKLSSLRGQQREAEHNYEMAINNRIRSKPFAHILNKVQASIVYYGKVKAALLAGYFIVPTSWVDAFAIRTDDKTPGRKKVESSWEPNITLRQRRLDQRQGRYVSPNPTMKTWREQRKQSDGSLKTIRLWQPDEIDDVAFPMDAVHPDIMARVCRAMDEKIFDEIGVARDQQNQRDPYIVGRIRQPAGGAISFMIAWYLNPESI